MLKEIARKLLNATGLKKSYLAKPETTSIHWKQLFLDCNLICVDVGGANDLPNNWQKIAKFGNFVVFEPDERSYENLLIKGRNNFVYINKALSKEGGVRKFNLYNTPTGSTFYNFRDRKDIHLEMNLPSNSYVHPIKQIELETTTLRASLDDEKISRIDMIKLDVQGAELEILEGMDDNRFNHLLSCEAEVNFHNIYEGGSTYEGINRKLIGLGFKLFDLRVVRYHKIPSQEEKRILSNYFNTTDPIPSLAGKIWEADHIYMRDVYWALNNFSSINEMKRLIIIYCIYNFYVDAIDVCEKWINKYPSSEPQINVIIQSILAIHKAELDNLTLVNAFLQTNQYQNWAQYEWVPYPSN